MELIILLRELLINFQLETENVLFVLIVLLFSLSFLHQFKSSKVPELFLFVLISIFIVTIMVSKYVKLKIPIMNGVSRANFIGQSSWDSTASLFVIIFSVYSVTLIFSLYRNTRRLEVKDSYLEMQIERNTKSKHLLTLILVVGAILIFPNIRGFAPQADRWIANGANWDVQNLLTWDELYIMGYTPMKDFWYPYGNLIFTEAFPSFGRLVLWIFQFSFLVLATFLVSNISNKKNVVYPVVTLFIFVFLFQTDFWGIVRYGLPTVVSGMLLYYFLNPKYKQNNFVIVQVALTVSPWIGGSVHLLLTVLCIIAIFISQIYQFRIHESKFFIHRFINRNTIPFISSWGIYTLYSAKQGQLSKELLHQFNSTSILEKNAYPMDIVGSFLSKPGLFTLIFLTMVIISAISLSRILVINSDLVELRNYCVMFLVTISGFLAAYKWSFRGDLNDIRSIAALSALLYISNGKIEFNTKSRLRIYNLVSIFLIGAILLGSIAKIFPTRIKNFSANLNVSTIEILKSENNRLKERQNYNSDFTQVDNLDNLYSYLKQNNLLPFYSPTDIGYLNVISKQKPYYYISSYDSSTKYDNEVLLDKLKSEIPKTIIIDVRSLYFDSIHLTLRHPLVIKWIVNNYQFHQTIGNYNIFTQNLNKSDGNLQGWNSLFGEIDLGNIPYYVSEGEECAKELECDRYIKVKLLKKGEFCKFTILNSDLESRFFFPIRYDSEFAIIPFSRLWPVDKLSKIKEISCAEKYELIDKELYDKLF
jgi:hypothetical protein